MTKTVSHLLAIFILAVAAGVLRADTPPPEKHSFAICLAEGVDKRVLTSSTVDWRDAKPSATPIITDADVVSYDILQHAITVTPEAMARVPRPPVSGTPILVVVDGEPVYLGALVTCVSSMAFHVPTIIVDRQALYPDEPPSTLVIDRAYPASWPTKLPDPRSDQRIVTALTALGKLIFRGPQVDDTLTRKIGHILMDSAQIRPGTTRKELLNLFTTEGGLSTATVRTYVHRRCRYIKVDVQFNLTQPDQHDEQPTDTVRKVSRPYLQWSIMD